MKKILVTGGLGYIGSHTVIKLIKSGYYVIIIDNLCKSSLSVLDNIEKITGTRPETFIFDCVKDRDLLERLFDVNRDIYGIIHFAGYKNVGESVEWPMMYYKNNLGALCQMLDLATTHNVKYFIFSSSCTVYGEPAKELLPITEQTTTGFTNCPYGNTKLFGERIISDFCNIHNLKAVNLRYFNPIGAHPSGLIGESPVGKVNNVLPLIIRAAKDPNYTLNIFGNNYNTLDGTCQRDYLDVNDLADAHVKAIEYAENMNSKTDVFNLGTGNPISVLELIKTFEGANNVKVKYQFAERRPGDVESIWADCSKANKLLNWKATTPLTESLISAWKWANQ